MQEQIRGLFNQSARCIDQATEYLLVPIAKAVEAIVECYHGGGKVLVFGNGGSAADAQHIVGELVGRLMFDRPPLEAEALSSDTSVLTCLANDYGYESVFSRQVEAKGHANDVAIALSTSGNSANVVAALVKAREVGMTTIAMTGLGGGRCAELADVLIDVPQAKVSPRIQEVHVVIYHVICQLVEEKLFGS